ncbi:MAG: hypothetical protein AB3N13_10955 [Arenibacterium sp.]
MITVITRLYDTNDIATTVLSQLKDAGFPARYLHLIVRGTEAAARMTEAKVAPDAAEKYIELIAEGHALVVVEAPFTPIGAARKAMQIMDATPALDAGVENETRSVEPELVYAGPGSILPDHPRFLTPREFGGRHMPVTAMLGFRMLKPRKSRLSVAHNPRRTMGGFYPLLSKKRRKITVSRNAKRITAGLFPLLTAHRRDMSASASLGPVFSQMMGLPLLIRR